MSGEVNVEKKDLRAEKKTRLCRVCGTKNAIIRKYGLMICRRCFKDVARDIGFKKYD